jgi:hypothetical protein
MMQLVTGISIRIMPRQTSMRDLTLSLLCQGLPHLPPGHDRSHHPTGVIILTKAWNSISLLGNTSK